MSGGGTTPATRAEVCVAALAETFRGDGEILANPIGTFPVIAGRLARATFEPTLLLTDTEALLIENPLPVGVAGADKTVAAWNPFRKMFDVVWSGRRHVIMGASQIDAYGNQNFALIGNPAQPKAQLLGFRGAPGNTVNHKTSYWIPGHSTRSFVEKVDVVTGLGYDRAAALGPAGRFHRLGLVVTDLAVLDFDTPEHRMRLRSVHPWASVDDVVAATGFELAIDGDVPTTAEPGAEALRLIREVIDPQGLRDREVPPS